MAALYGRQCNIVPQNFPSVVYDLLGFVQVAANVRKQPLIHDAGGFQLCNPLSCPPLLIASVSFAHVVLCVGWPGTGSGRMGEGVPPPGRPKG